MLTSAKIKKWKARILLVSSDSPVVATSTPSLYDIDLGDYRVVGIYRDLLNASFSLPKSKPEILVITVPEDVEEFFFDKLKKIRNNYLSLKILILTDNTDSNFIFELISVGISGILPSTSTWPEIVNQLDKIEQGFAPLPPLVARVILDSFRLNMIPDLSKRQIEILKLMFLGMTYITISKHLDISTETTKTHMKNIYRKLNVNSREEALAKAIEERVIIFNI